jgi:hypothetical protein
MDHEADLQWFRSFVVNSRWRFAKTYVESYPHEYTLERRTEPEKLSESDSLHRTLRRRGVVLECRA